MSFLSPDEPDRSHIDGYLAALATQRRLADHTLSAYRRDLERLAVLAQQLPGVSVPTLHHFHFRSFAAQLHGSGLNPRSIARILSAWRGLYRWLAEQGKIASNPLEGVRPPKRGKPLPKALAADDATRLVAMATPGKDADAPAQRCNRAMFELLYSSGLRVSELTSLDVHYIDENGYRSTSWLDMNETEVHVTGKGGKKRNVPVGKGAMEALSAWLPLREALATKATGDARFALFIGDRGTRISDRTVQLRIKAHGLALGIPANVHPHMMRHSFASHLLQSSGDLRAVQELLGHASIAATQIYTSLDFQRLATVYDAAHPRAKKKHQP